MRINLSPQLIRQGRGIVLPSAKAHHIATVMRYKTGDEFVVLDGEGGAYKAVIASIKDGKVIVDILGQTTKPEVLPFQMFLCAGLLKGDKMDFVVQKATELGAREIVPLVTERCQLRETKKIERWRKIAEESVEQCGGAFLPNVREAVIFDRFIEECLDDLSSPGLIFMEDWGKPVDEAIESTDFSFDRIRLLIGPEGGFTPDEYALAEKAGFVRTTLGSNILRAETASIAALAIVRFVLERRVGKTRSGF